MIKPKLNILLVLVILAGASLACQLNLGGPPAPPTATPEALPVPTNTVPPIEDLISTPVSGTPGEVEVTLTEAQLTEYARQELSSQPDAILQDPEVRLHDGVIEIFGQVEQGIVSGKARLTLTPTIDEDGKPNLELTSANLGPVPLPQSVLDRFSGIINQMIIDGIESEAPGLRLTEILVTEGKMTVRGQAE